MALSGPGTLDTERDRRLLNCTLRAQGQLTTVVEQRQPPGSSGPSCHSPRTPRCTTPCHTRRTGKREATITRTHRKQTN